MAMPAPRGGLARVLALLLYPLLSQQQQWQPRARGHGPLIVPDSRTLQAQHDGARTLRGVGQLGRPKWPDHTSLILDEGEPAYVEAIVQAGRVYNSLIIGVPRPECELLNATSSSDYHVTVHTKDQTNLDALVHVRAVRSPIRLFLGPSLVDGYAVIVGDAFLASSITRGGRSTSCDSPLLFSNSTETFWLSFRVSNALASLRLGYGTTLGSLEKLRLADSAPPPAGPDGLRLWASPVPSGELEVCPAGVSSEAVLVALEHPEPMVKVVQAGTASSECYIGGPAVPELEVAGSSWPLPLVLSEASLSSSSTPFGFMQGGRYRLCYKPDAVTQCKCVLDGRCVCDPGGGPCTPSLRPHGSCDPHADPATSHHNSLLPPLLLVLGVSSSCRFDGCLGRERWDCYFDPLREGGRHCVIDLSPESGRTGWALVPGAVSRMTWTATYGPDAHVRGVLERASPRDCGESSEASLNFEGLAGTNALASFELLPTSSSAVRMPGVLPGVLEPFTVGVCYCPEVTTRSWLGPCGSREDFIQAFGVLYMWTLRICDYELRGACAVPYLRVLPQQQFMLKIVCPPGGGCVSGTGNRVKFLDARVDWGHHSNWNANAACKTVREESEDAIWPSQDDSLSISGGPRIDYKIWGEKQVLLDRTLGQKFEVCYCNGACDRALNWIKVGSVPTAHAFPFGAFTSDILDGRQMQTVEFVNKPGSFTLYGGIHRISWQSEASPYESNQYSGVALLNLISFDREEAEGLTLARKYRALGGGLLELQGAMDRECQREVYSADLVEGLTSKSDALARMAFAAAQGSFARLGRYMAFAGPGRDRSLTVRKAGTLAACYCARVTSAGNCLAAQHWLFAGLLQIRGPRGGQSWTLPTKTVIRITGIQGWGFDSTDGLRLLDTGASCFHGDFQPGGSTWYKVGCPGGPVPTAGSCAEAAPDQVVVALLADSVRMGIRIKGILIEGPRSSVLKFSGPISRHLRDGDAMTINPEDILVDGRTLADMSDMQRHAAYTLSGQQAFQDNPGRRYFRYWHRVQHVGRHGFGATTPDAARGTDPSASKLRIPVGWEAGRPGGMPAFSFGAQAAGNTGAGVPPQWVRRNMMDTGYELKAMRPRQSMPICWSPLDGGTRRSYAQAGVVTFVDPQLMQTASFSLTTRQSGSLAPAVISFTVNKLNRAYERVQGEMVLTLRVLQTAKLAVALGSVVLSHGSALPAASMSQAACGRLFLELWASDAHGFPVPRGCYYGAAGATGEPGEREFFVVFDRFNGLRNSCRRARSTCHYQLVVQAIATGLWRTDRVLDLYSGCRYEAGGCRSEFELYERGEATMDAGTLPEAGPRDASLDAAMGFQLLDVDADGVHHLGALEAAIHARLQAGGPQGIKRGSILRIYLAPLTQWDAGYTPCHAAHLNASSTGTCSKEQVVPTTLGFRQNYNVLKITVPQKIDMFVGAALHTVRITGVDLPKAALFPTRLGVQVTSASDDAPHYVASAGYVAFLWQGSPSAHGRLLVAGQTGEGPHPFQSDKNTLYARLQFAASLWTGSAVAVPDSAGPVAFVDVLVPPGYSCYVQGNGSMPHPFIGMGVGAEYALVQQSGAPYDNAPESIFLLDRDEDNHADFSRGTLSTAESDGSWETSLGQAGCSYGLRPGQAVHAGQVVAVRLSLDNPSTPLRKAAPSNTWALRLRGRGALGASGKTQYKTRADPFLSLAQERVQDPLERGLWAGNVAVLGPLRDVLVQPASFAPGALHLVSVFFGSLQDVGYGGEVVVEAPLSFAFNETCAAEDLEAAYYDPSDPATHQLPLGPVQRLPQRGACTGEATPEAQGIGTNRARIRVLGRLASESNYGFRLRVVNPLSAPPPGRGGWFVWTVDADEFLVDGSTQRASFIPGLEAEGWELYRQAWPSPPLLYIRGDILQPFSVFRQMGVLVVEGLAVLEQGGALTSLRVTGPPMCRFVDPAADGVRLTTSRSTTSLPYAPRLGALGQLLWPSLTLHYGEVYGFEARLEVLEFAREASLHVFFLELGYTSTTTDGRLGALTVAAPSISRVFVAPVDYLTSQVGCTQNILVFRLRTASHVPLNGGAGLIIESGEDFRGGRLDCRPRALEAESLPLPLDASCEAGTNAAGAPFLLLKPGRRPFEAGLYALEVQASNPPATAGLEPTDWTVGIFYKASDTFARTPIDAPAEAAGFPLRHVGVLANISWMPGAARDNRPGRNSTVLIAFSLALGPAQKQPEASQLRVRAPRSFAFAADCLDSVFTLREDTLGAVWRGEADYEDWPPAQAPSSCAGCRNVATITVSRGLKSDHRYALQLAVVNAELPSAMNFWVVEYDTETSELLQGFPLALVTFPLSIAAVSTAAGHAVAAPVTVSFKLQQPLPPGGELRLMPPPGFILRNATVLRVQGTTHDPPSLERGIVSALDGTALAVRVGPSGVPARVLFAMQAFVANPDDVAMGGGLWTLTSFSATGAPLDEGRLAGYHLVEAASLAVRNIHGQYNSLESVNISISITSPFPLLVGEVLRLEAPAGLLLLAQPDDSSTGAAGQCTGFGWLQWLSTSPQPTPVCSCPFGPCSLLLAPKIDRHQQPASGGMAYPAALALSFQLSSVNPGRDPPLDKGYWRIVHSRGAANSSVLASGVQRSWHVRPKLKAASVALVGSSQAAGSESAIRVSLVPVSSAYVAWLVAEYPVEMSFDYSTVEVPYLKDSRSKGPNLIISHLNLMGGSETSILVANVRLGRGGGRSIFSLTTYRTAELAVVVDERAYFKGFYQPGRASLTGTLRGSYATRPETYPARGSLPARGFEVAQATFQVSFSVALAWGDRLLLKCEGGGSYVLKADGQFAFFLLRQAHGSDERRSINAQAHSHGDYGLEVLLGGERAALGSDPGTPVVESGRVTELVVRVVPTLRINSWRLETFRGALLTNTNDGISAGFSPVAALDVLLEAQRAPPRAAVRVQLHASAPTGLLQGITPAVPELLIIAPPGFSFPKACGSLCIPLPASFGSTGRAMARLQSPDAKSLLDRELSFFVTSPVRMPGKLQWIVQAKSLGDSMVGWGSVPSFQVNQMPNTAIFYGAIRGLRKAQIAFQFTLSVEPGDRLLRTIEVSGPAAISISCRAGEIWPISLPGGPPICERDGPGQLRMHLGETLRPGPYAFVAEVGLPAETPEPNSFSLIIRDSTTDAVADAALDVPGWPLMHLPVAQPNLAWSRAGFGQLSTVTVGFYMSNSTALVRSLLMTLPPGFKHRVMTATDIKSSNIKLPLRRGGQDWIDSSSPDRLRILLESTDPTIAVGSYRLSFPVDLPDTRQGALPLNVWFLDLCSDGSCLRPRGPSALASFPMAGFLPGEVSELEAKRTQAAAARDARNTWHSVSCGRRRTVVAVWALLRLCTLAFALWHRAWP